jgi:hypothetical protein
MILILNIVKKCVMSFFCLEARPLISSTARNFMCSNNVSIDRQYVCDLHKDCPEGEDEKQDCGECNDSLIRINILAMDNGNTLDLYSQRSLFKSHSGYLLPSLRILLWFSEVPPAKFWDSTSVSPRQCPTNSLQFIICHSTYNSTV